MYNTYLKLRDAKGLTDYKVAKECEISQATLSQWKSGRSTPKVTILLKIAELLGTTVEELMREEEQQ